MMKHLPMLALLIGLPLLIVSCRKQTNSDQTNDPVPGLPPATQIGANTFGFLLNGQPWVPSGNNGTANLSIDFDPGFSKGIFGVSAYKVVSPSNVEYFGLGTDSLNYRTVPFSVPLYYRSIFSLGFQRNSCDYLWIDTLLKATGNLTISKLDRTNNVIAGLFNATLIKGGCDTIKITKGRFDMKF